MDAKEIVRTWITALQSGAMEEAAEYMTPDFTLVGWTPQPLDQQEFLALQAQLDAGMPDFSYNLSNLHSHHNEVVTALIQVVGTHMAELAFPQLGIPAIPQLGQQVALPQVPVEFTLKEDRVAQMKVQPVVGCGMEGLLQQLDTDVPLSVFEKGIAQLGNRSIEQEIEVRTDDPFRGQTDTSFPVSEYPE